MTSPAELTTKRPSHITCACGAKRAVPKRGATPKRCVACQEVKVRETQRARSLVYSRLPETKLRRQKRREDTGHW